jgi:hypothetical protein
MDSVVIYASHFLLCQEAITLKPDWGAYRESGPVFQQDKQLLSILAFHPISLHLLRPLGQLRMSFHDLWDLLRID